ncbi:MAG: glycoside hydrolase family 3 N-terminal domain-containing protein [Pseudomonadota bacterium]
MVSAAILAPSGPRLKPKEFEFFADAQPWGFILFARNVETPAQLRRLTGDLREAVGRNAPVLIDQEGGRVQRLRGPTWREWLPALDQIARAGPGAERSMWLRARLIAHELFEAGIDVNCAPLADVARPMTHAVLKNRTYGTDPAAVARLARAVADGLMAGGVLPVLKHLPGYGLGAVDSHVALPRVTAERADLEAIDFQAFRPLADIAMGMTAHIAYDAIDPHLPATLSPTLVQLIREEIGFGGLLMTDDISMDALPGALAGRASKAIAAGCDVVLHCNGDLMEMEDVIAAVGQMKGRARVRARLALEQRRAPEPLDIGALDAEFNGLLAGPADDANSAQTGE